MSRFQRPLMVAFARFADNTKEKYTQLARHLNYHYALRAGVLTSTYIRKT